MSNLIKHAEKELKLLGADSKDSAYGGALMDITMPEVLRLVIMRCVRSGQSLTHESRNET